MKNSASEKSTVSVVPKAPHVIKELNVNDILQLGRVMMGNAPTVYWDMDLTGAETKILRYLYANILRISIDLARPPRGKDGSPRFWREKKRMANECKVSESSFRNSVRSLYKRGILTSMDPQYEGDLSEFCVGLSLDFLSEDKRDELSALEGQARMDKLVRVLYDSFSVSLYEKQQSMQSAEVTVVPASLPITAKPDEPVEEKPVEPTEDESAEVEESTVEESVVEEKPALREPITEKVDKPVEREAISSTKKHHDMARYRAKREELDYVLSPYERHVWTVGKFYDTLVRQASNRGGYTTMPSKRPKGWRNSRRWNWLNKLCEAIEQSGVSYPDYIRAQFERCKWFKRNQSYPYLNQMFSDNAIRYAQKYVQEEAEKYAIVGGKKKKPEKPVINDFTKEVIEAVISDCEGMKKWMEKAPKRPAFKECSPEELKILYVRQHWMRLSKYYLASVSWFVEWLDQIQGLESMDELKDTLRPIVNSKSMMNTIKKVVAGVEREMNVPEFPSLAAAG